jgi:hypothetical protein
MDSLTGGLYAAVADVFRSLGVVMGNNLIKVRNAIVDMLQINKLVVNTTPTDQTNPSAQQKDATIGQAQINKGEGYTYIMNNQVGEGSMIFVTPAEPVAMGVCEKNSAEITIIDNVARPQGFKVCLKEPAEKIIKFNWWIVGTVEDENWADGLNGEPVISIESGEESPSLTPDMSQAEIFETTDNNIVSETTEAEPSQAPSVSPTPIIEPEVSATPEPTSEPSVLPEPTQEPEVSESPTPSIEPSPEASAEPEVSEEN